MASEDEYKEIKEKKEQQRRVSFYHKYYKGLLYLLLKDRKIKRGL